MDPTADTNAPLPEHTAEPAPTPMQRWGPRLGLFLSTLVAGAYVLATMRWRFEKAFGEYSADPDMRQAVWQYWRYHVDGAFPPGDVLTDYAFVMHAPLVWWLMMASLSVFLKPYIAATVLNVFAYLATCGAAYAAVRQRSNHYVALMGAVLIAHSTTFHGVSAGGYARTFGPLLTLLFLTAFIAKRHYLVLVVLVLQAALYPSVVIPCGLTYGVYCMLVGEGLRQRVRRTLETGAVGGIVIAFGLYQDLLAPDWWGSVVWLREALEMPAWGPGGRINEAPLRDPGATIWLNIQRTFNHNGHRLVEPLQALNARHGNLLSVGVFCVMLLFVIARRLRTVPVELAALFAGSLGGYFLARLLAFKLYLPYRSLTHVVPYVIYVAIPLMAWAIAHHLLPRRTKSAIALAIVLGLGPVFALTGSGLGPMRATYGDYGREKAVYQFVEKLPLDAMIAGNLYIADRLPLFAYHQVYINRVLAHPFRKGLYAEIERRIEVNYNMLWGSDGCEILKLARAEGITHVVYPNRVMNTFDRALFEPVRSRLAKVFTKNRKRFFLAKPPEDAVVFSKGGWRVVDIDKLATTLAPTCERAPSPEAGTE